jgi:glycosyltransferase involved in cell wall biosynthesis
MIQQGIPGPITLTLIQQPNGCAAWRVCWPAYDYNGTPETGEQTRVAQLVVLHRSAWAVGDWARAIAYRDFIHDQGKVLGYETDDDLYSEDVVERIRSTGDAELNARSDRQLEDERQARIFALRLADGVTVSTEALAAVCRRFTEAPVLVVPNAIDLVRFRTAIANHSKRTADSPLTIGWAGGNRPDSDAEKVAVAWGRIARRFPQVRFLVGGFPLKSLMEAVPADRLAYIEKLPLGQYPAIFSEIDIGCCPLEPSTFNASKSPIKAMELAAAGAAVVASPTVYDDFIRDNHDGLIANHPDEWEWALAQMIEHPGRRQMFATRLLARVEAAHSLAGTVTRWPAAWARIVDAHLERSGAVPATVPADPTPTGARG